MLSDLEISKTQSITTLDLTNNEIDNKEVIECFQKLSNLIVLYLVGNTIIKHIQNYRKTLINKFPELTYLDDKPVFPEERRFALAFANGGIEEEKKERQKFKDEEAAKAKKSRDDFEKMLENARNEAKKKKELEEIGSNTATLEEKKDQELKNPIEIPLKNEESSKIHQIESPLNQASNAGEVLKEKEKMNDKNIFDMEDKKEISSSNINQGIFR